MDPSATLNDLITAVIAGEIGEANYILQNLADWHASGGFAPDDPRPGDPQAPGLSWGTSFVRRNR